VPPRRVAPGGDIHVAAQDRMTATLDKLAKVQVGPTTGDDRPAPRMRRDGGEQRAGPEEGAGRWLAWGVPPVGGRRRVAFEARPVPSGVTWRGMGRFSGLGSRVSF
jgi:hypothetical protein